LLSETDAVPLTDANSPAAVCCNVARASRTTAFAFATLGLQTKAGILVALPKDKAAAISMAIVAFQQAQCCWM
jgi:hypothetical protein